MFKYLVKCHFRYFRLNVQNLKLEILYFHYSNIHTFSFLQAEFLKTYPLLENTKAFRLYHINFTKTNLCPNRRYNY